MMKLCRRIYLRLLTFYAYACVTSSQLSKTDLNEDNSSINNSRSTFVYAIRVQASDVTALNGFTELGISIVKHDVPVKVIIFGEALNMLRSFGFTESNNCSKLVTKFQRSDFALFGNARRVTVDTTFKKADTIYKLCVQNSALSENYLLYNDSFMEVSTKKPVPEYYMPLPLQISVTFMLLLFSALFSGLTIGLMSLTPQELVLISKSGTQQEQIYAQQILPVRKTGNYLLCSLLIGNTIINSSISILCDDIMSGIYAIILATVGIVIVGEILPQAICVKKGLAVGARTIFITRFIMFLTFPVSYPISKFLDMILGVESISYNRKRLMELIKIATQHAEDVAEELKIAVGAMQMTDKTVADVMTKIQDVFMLPDTTVLNAKTVTEILFSGYTRIPVYSGDRNNVVSLLFIKDLALLDPDDNFTVKTVCGFHEHKLRFVSKETKISRMLDEFKKGEYHLALVQETPLQEDNLLSVSLSDETDNAKRTITELLGIVTLEDILEEILQAEIVDETDAITDNVHRRRRRRRRAQLQELDFINYDTSMGMCAISMQMQMVTVQWLTTNHAAFQAEIITRPVLERLIRQNVHKLEFTHLTDMKDPDTVYPKSAHLYTKGQQSEKFILILEGRAFVTIGQTNMTFEAGPWHFFGTELLDKLLFLVHRKNPTVKAQKKSAMSSTSTLAKNALSRLRKPPVRASSFTSNYDNATSSNETNERSAAFMPDFSAVIRDSCTYLEITAESYLLAYRSTLITRNQAIEFLAKNKIDLQKTPAIFCNLADITPNNASSNDVSLAHQRQTQRDLFCVNSALLTLSSRHHEEKEREQHSSHNRSKEASSTSLLDQQNLRIHRTDSAPTLDSSKSDHPKSKGKTESKMRRARSLEQDTTDPHTL